MVCGACRKAMKGSVGVRIWNGVDLVAADEYRCPGCGQVVWSDYAPRPIASGTEARAVVEKYRFSPYFRDATATTI